MAETDHIINAFEELSPRYEQVVDSELHKFWGWRYKNFVEKMLESIPTNTDGLILDVATGTGFIPRKLSERHASGCRIVGLDITFGMLKNGKIRIKEMGAVNKIYLACGDAMSMPFKQDSFDTIICGLATHHMRISRLLSEMNRVLISGGKVIIADVGGSSYWRSPAIKGMVRIATFLYFLITTNLSRARAESSALPNVYTRDEWHTLFTDHGYIETNISQLPAKRAWIPSPLLMRATKP
jgi:ubiquinone/menaquinone biosynthesis C-methylase UbiE